jgi:class 3 adenylate cyclase
METHHHSGRSLLHWWIHGIAVALAVILISFLELLDGIDVWAYKLIVAQIANETLQNRLSVATATDALATLSIVEPTQSLSTFQQIPPVVTAVLLTVTAFTAVWMTRRFQLAVSFGLTALLSAGYVLVAVVMSLATHWVWPLSVGVLALTVGYGVMAADSVVLARKQRRFVGQVFSRYVPADLADIIWQQRMQFLPGSGLCSQKLSATVLFAEMNGFALEWGVFDTGIITKWTTDYLDTMARLVVDHRGVVEQCFGDALKANFGVPFPRAHSDEIQADASQAVACAVAMGEALQVLNRRWQDRGFPPIDMRVGLSTGEVAALCVGRASLLKFTTMGEAVRCAGQLARHPHEPDDPALGLGSCRILAVATTAAYLSERFWLHQIETESAADGSQSMAVYRVYGKHDRPACNRAGDLRVSLRVEIMTPVALAYGTCANGLTSNIGVGGMAVCRLVQPLRIGTTTLLRFEVPGHAQAIKAAGTVVWTKQDRAGIAFGALTPSDRAMLDSFVIQEASKRSPAVL